VVTGSPACAGDDTIGKQARPEHQTQARQPSPRCGRNRALFCVCCAFAVPRSGAFAMPHARLAIPLILLSAVVAANLGAPAGAQAPRPGQQAPPPARGQTQPAQPPQPAPPKPYKPVPVTLAQPHNDPSFEAFRKQLADIASRKDRAALARLVVARNFFWIGEKGDRADRRKPGGGDRARRQGRIGLADACGGGCRSDA